MASNNQENSEYEFQQWRLNKLNDLKYHRAVCMMICGAGLDEVAKQLGQSKRNVQRFFESSEFNENLSRAIHLTFKSSLSKAALYADRALDILIEISEDTTQPVRYRLQAISELFKVSMAAGLNNTLPSDLEVRLHTEGKLLSHYNTVRSLGGDLSTQGLPSAKLNIENQRAIWMELYPSEPFPNEESYRQWFNTHELGQE
jgi:hypothetical protein